MQNLDLVAEELFNKIRGRFPSVTIGDAEGNVTNEPSLGRYFDFNFMSEGRPVGKVSVSLDNKAVAVVYGEDLVATEGNLIKNNWYDFLKELRMFAKKRTLTFDTRDITKSNLNSRDYKFLAKNRDGDESMKESKLYGTSKLSYQNFDGARLMIKHTEGINQEMAGGRAKKVGSLYIESAEGERFKYPFKHLTGARAMTRHVAEGGKPFDDFGKHIVSMSEEMSKLRKFKTYMGRSAVMAESLAGYMDVVRERIATVKKTLESLQRPSYYKETFEAFAPAVMEDVPSDVAENWIDQLTIKQFNEELSDVFPYIYNLVSEATKATELGPLDLQGYTVHEVAGPKDCWDGYKKDGTQKGTGKNKGKRVNKCVPEDAELEQGFDEMMGQFTDESFDPSSEPSQRDLAVEDMMDVYEKGGEKALAAHIQISEEELDQDINEWCAEHGKHADDDRDEAIEGVIEELADATDFDEGDNDTMDVKIDKDGAISKDGGTDEKEQKTPLGEFILSYFDRDNGTFPKGETAVLTMIEKDYGEQFINPAKKFIEQIQAKFDEHQMHTDSSELDEVFGTIGLGFVASTLIKVAATTLMGAIIGGEIGASRKKSAGWTARPRRENSILDFIGDKATLNTMQKKYPEALEMIGKNKDIINYSKSITNTKGGPDKEQMQTLKKMIKDEFEKSGISWNDFISSVEPLVRKSVKDAQEKMDDEVEVEVQQMEAPDTGEFDRIRELAGLR